MVLPEKGHQPNLPEIVEATHQEVRDVFFNGPMQLTQEGVQYQGWQKAEDGTDLPIYDSQPYSTVGEIDGKKILNILPSAAESLGVGPDSYVEIGYAGACFTPNLGANKKDQANEYHPEQSIFLIITPHESPHGNFISYETIELDVDPHQEQPSSWFRSTSIEETPETADIDVSTDELLGKIAMGEGSEHDSKESTSLSHAASLSPDEMSRITVAGKSGSNELGIEQAQVLREIAGLLSQSM